MPSIQLPYGLKGGLFPVHISEVPTGLACDCLCPQCRRQLVAKKGQLNVHHFAHRSMRATECIWATESALHRLAKEILLRERQIWFPRILEPSDSGLVLIWPDGWFRYESVQLEQQVNDVRPDLIVAAGDQVIMIEIAVSNFCNEAKLKKIEAAGVSSIEIDLSKFNLFNANNNLRKALLEDAPRKWLFHSNGYRLAIKIEAPKEEEPRPKRPPILPVQRTYLSRTAETIALAHSKLRNADVWLDTKHPDLSGRTPRESAIMGTDHDFGWLEILIEQAAIKGK